MENFRERLKDNPFVESLSESSQKPAKAQLEADINFVSAKENPLVDTLINKWRNNLLAHIAPRPIVNENQISAQYPITAEEVGQLLEDGMAILNRYSNLFRANTYSTQIVGHDDYNFVLRSVRENLKLMEHRIEEQAETFRKRPRKL